MAHPGVNLRCAQDGFPARNSDARLARFLGLATADTETSTVICENVNTLGAAPRIVWSSTRASLRRV